MKIGVYGGTFDPIHRGHMAAARAAAGALGLDRLLLIPDGEPPHKKLSYTSAPGADRLEMTRIAADRLGLDIPVDVLDLEQTRPGKSYTSDTVRALRLAYPEDELWLLMGTDMFLTFHLWHEPEEILRQAGICAFGRTEQDGEELFAPQRDYLAQKYGGRIVTITLPGLVEVSSTQLRTLLGQGKGQEYLDESVYGYILLYGLYGVKKDLKHLDWEDLRAASYSMIRSKRIPHVRGTEATAVHLAERWGADPDAARAAAILHDCTQYLDLDQQLSLCGKYGILLDDLERRTLKLLHAKTGAAIAREVFGMPEPVWQAICWHTTGRPGMTALEKILYIADYMEPSRDFPGVERLRALVETDLDAAVMLGLEMTIEEMNGYGTAVHPNTIRALDALRKEHTHG